MFLLLISHNQPEVCLDVRNCRICIRLQRCRYFGTLSICLDESEFWTDINTKIKKNSSFSSSCLFVWSHLLSDLLAFFSALWKFRIQQIFLFLSVYLLTYSMHNDQNSVNLKNVRKQIEASYLSYKSLVVFFISFLV